MSVFASVVVVVGCSLVSMLATALTFAQAIQAERIRELRKRIEALEEEVGP